MKDGGFNLDPLHNQGLFTEGAFKGHVSPEQADLQAKACQPLPRAHEDVFGLESQRVKAVGQFPDCARGAGGTGDGFFKECLDPGWVVIIIEARAEDGGQKQKDKDADSQDYFFKKAHYILWVKDNMHYQLPGF